MSLHAVTKFLQYKWRAKSRHGIHSPFVYDLIDHVLLDKGPIDRTHIIKSPGLSLTYENLISRIAAYYGYKTILSLPLTGKPQQADLLLFNETAPGEWQQLLNEYYPILTNESAVIVSHIHKTREHSTAWKKLCAHDSVRMSIDLYGIGLFFFKKEFKEKQHFILKY